LLSHAGIPRPLSVKKNFVGVIALWHHATVHRLDSEEGERAADAKEEKQDKFAVGEIDNNREDEGDQQSVLAKYVAKKRWRNFVDVLWPVAFCYGETIKALIGRASGCRVRIIIFDGVWCGFEEVLKTIVYAPQIEMGGWMYDQVRACDDGHVLSTRNKV